MTEVAQPARDPWTSGSTTSPMQTFDHGSIIRRDTPSILADETQKVARGIAKILQNRKPKWIDVITDVNEVLQAVKIRLPDESSLIPSIKELQFNSRKLEMRLIRRGIFWPFGLLLDPGLNELTQKLSHAVQNLKLRGDMQVAIAMNRLHDNATTTSTRYSNADLSRFFEQGVLDWRPYSTNVDIDPQGATAEVTLRNANNDVARVNYFQTDGFESACALLEGYLSAISCPIESMFSHDSLHPPSSSKNKGEIKLESAEPSSAPIMLWVYHSVFLRLELLASKKSTSTKPDNTSFHNLGIALCKNITKDSVENKGVARSPHLEDDFQPPKSVPAGKVFSIKIPADPQDFLEVICQTQNIVYSGSKNSAKGYKAFFLATEEGDVNIDFCFAHHDTLNFTNKRATFTIDRSNKKPTLPPSSVPVLRKAKREKAAGSATRDA